MIISFGGAHGSGKSTIASRLAAELGWPRYYIGGLRREAAKKRGMTLAEYNLLGESDPRTDLEVDEYQKKLGETEDNFVIEGRTSWHFIPHSIKIYLDVAEEEAVRRIYSGIKDRTGEFKDINSPDDLRRSLRERFASDNRRYAKYFNIDVYNPKNYDFYLDTTNLSIDEVYEKVLAYIRSAKS